MPLLVFASLLWHAKGARVNPHAKMMNSEIGLIQSHDDIAYYERKITYYETGDSSCARLDSNEIVGCENHCQCSWSQHCYPKLVSRQEGQRVLKGFKGNSSAQNNIAKSNMTDTINIGVCDTSMPVLILGAFALFAGTLSAFVALRTLFLWLETVEPPFNTEKSAYQSQSGFQKKACSMGKNSLPEFVPVSGPTSTIPGPPGSSGEVDSESDEADADVDAEPKVDANVEPEATTNSVPAT